MNYLPDPTNVDCFFFLASSLPPSADPTYINILTNSKQDILKEPEVNTNLLYFLALSYYKSSVEKNFPIFLSHSCIRIIVLTCPDNIKYYVTNLQEIISRNHACLHNHTNHNVARPILFQMKSSLPFSLFLFT